MKLIIAGSRSLDYQEDEILTYLNSSKMIPIEDIDEVVCGLAKGPDLIGKWWADAYGIPVKEFPANWDLHGRYAGFYRNTQMAEYADEALIFWDGISKGSSNMADEMFRLNKKVKIINMSLTY